MTTRRFIAEAVAWERVQVRVDGRIEGTEPAARLAEGTFFLQEARSMERVAVEHASIQGDRFVIRENVVRGRRGRPLETGEWGLYYGDLDAAQGTRVTMDPDLRNDPCGASGLFTGGGIRYWVVPVCDSDDRGFAFAVSYRRKYRRAGRPRFTQRLKSRVKARRRQMTTFGFVAVYRLARRVGSGAGRRILFTSDSRAELSGNLGLVHDRMIERGLDQEYHLSCAFKPSITARRPLREKIRFPWLLGRADIVVMDDYQPPIYKVDFPGDVKLVQLWHASGAFKTVGYSRLGKPGGPAPYSPSHRIYTHAIVSSEHDVRFYAEAFGVAESRVHPTGIPRMDAFFDEDAIEAARARAREAVPSAEGRRVILFAPTFRGKGPSDAYYDFDLIDMDALFALCEELDAIVVFKMHPFVMERVDVPERYRGRLVDASEYRVVNDLLTIADLVVTDYSSLVFEYSTLGRPMLFFAYDLDDYTATRDFYVDMEEFVPGKIVGTFDELLQAIRDEDYEEHKVEAFAERHFDHHDSGSTDRVIDLILGE